MPVTSVKNYPDPEQYESAYLPAKAEITPSTRGPFQARVAELKLNRISLQRVYESAPCIKHMVQAPIHAVITFCIPPGGNLTIDGIRVPENGLMRHSRGHSYHEYSSGALHWGAISLPVEDMVSGGASIAGQDLAPPLESVLVVPLRSALAHLHGVHAAAASLAETAQDIIASPAVEHGLEQTLIEATIGCLSTEGQEERAAQRYHKAIMRRFRRVLDENSDQALYIPEICAAIGVPERTLRLCCQEHLGIGPQRFLVLRRMHLAQRALRIAGPGHTTVTEIATRYGFWHFGRFATRYTMLFGELPSATLNREPE